MTTASNHLQNLKDKGIIKDHTPHVDYDALGYDMTAVTYFKVEGSALTGVTEPLVDEPQMVLVYEITGDYDVLTVGKFRNTNSMNRQIKMLLSETPIRESSTSVVLNAVSENEQFGPEDDSV